MDVPWITYEACKYLEAITKKNMCVFEWGVGGSTIFFGNHAQSVVTIEHDQKWLGVVIQQIREKGLQNCESHLVVAEAGRLQVHPDPYWPENYFEPHPANTWHNSNFKRYASAIDRFPEGHFDIIMVDGVARGGCLQHAAPKLKEGGYLIWDNSDRKYDNKYTAKLFEPWDRAVFWGYGPINDYKWETTIWKKVGAEKT